MLPPRIGPAARSVAAALAASAIAAAAGSLAAPAPAGVPPPCDNADPTLTTTTAETPGECETTTETTTTTETVTTVDTLPQEPTTAPAETPPPPPLVATTAPRPTPRPSVPTTTARRPVPTEPNASNSSTAVGDDSATAAPLDNGTPTLVGGPYVFPVLAQASFSDTWGAARADVGWHHGVDIFAGLGSPVVAVADGVLFSVGWNTVGGRRLWLRDRAGNFFYYAHLSRFAAVAAEGARVRAGTVIAYVGNTGDAAGTPYHLHFEIHPSSLLSLGYDGAVDPFPYVSAWQRVRRPTDASAAPAPGAILIGYTDISSAEGLDPDGLEQTLKTPIAARTVAAEPAPRPVRTAGPAIAPARPADARTVRELDSAAGRPAAAQSNVWDSLSRCESGGNWSANTGNGYVGGLQFLPQTWNAHGGGEFAPSADLASRSEQIAIAGRVLASQGWGAWPACSQRLGLATPGPR
ncbi:MAG: transglycosylase family protein [Gaiellaceae bacterium]